MTMRKRENLTYGGIALGSVVFLLWIIPAYTPPYPGYGVSAALLPNVAVGIILVLSVLALLRNVLSHSSAKSLNSEESQFPEEDQSGDNSQEGRVHLWHLARFFIPCFLVLPAMKWVGFIPAGLVFVLVIQYLCGQRKLVPTVLVPVGTVGIMYVALRYGLSVPMP